MKGSQISSEKWTEFKSKGLKLLEKYGIKKENVYEFTEDFEKNFLGGLYSLEHINDFVNKCSIPYPLHLKEMLARIVIFLNSYWKGFKGFSPTDDELNSIVVTLFWIMCSEMGYKNTTLWDTSVIDFYGRKVKSVTKKEE